MSDLDNKIKQYEEREAEKLKSQKKRNKYIEFISGLIVGIVLSYFSSKLFNDGSNLTLFLIVGSLLGMLIGFYNVSKLQRE